ncbi:hypothetical protein [Pseudodesulfovibrio indicus]|uniref:hypothetical protein n=1 Tax=Pseudodesulfovibrio indicus TaxID=1716143 RepID=UPI0010627D4C|nr:hypothetical protein [Pseudodesulfovibrio indicus]
MSGTGGGNGGGSGGGGGAHRECPDFFEETVLNSPNHIVLANLEEGDLLSVYLNDEGGHSTVLAVDGDGNSAGSITIGSLAQLIECLEDGYDYVAVVVSVDGGHCRVQIRLESDL